MLELTNAQIRRLDRQLRAAVFSRGALMTMPVIGTSWCRPGATVPGAGRLRGVGA